MGVSSDRFGFDRGRIVVLASVLAVLAIQLLAYPMPLGNWIREAILGLLGAMLAMGMALVYRANRLRAGAELPTADCRLPVSPAVASRSGADRPRSARRWCG